MLRFEDAFQVMQYPAGESHVSVKQLPDDGEPVLAANVRNFEALGNVLAAQEILYHNNLDCPWFIPYFPFARHDRRRHRHDGFELGVAMRLAEQLQPVVVLDPHSDVLGIMAHIPQSELVQLWVKMGLFSVPKPAILVPDTGASKKAETWCRAFGFPVVQGYKKRDPATGQLSGFGIIEEEGTAAALHGADLVIVDDICDAGGTFLGLAEAVQKKYPVNSFTLAVSHGLFTKGTEVLMKTFNRIYTTGREVPGIQCVSYEEVYTKGARV